MDGQLTVIIPCKDERRNIRACIGSVRGLADEILVADSGSSDGTPAIVEQAGGCRVIEREYVHSGDFKNWAIPQARCPWVFILDADERLTAPLAEEIRRTLSAPSHDGYRVHRDNYFLGHRIRFSGWQGAPCLRLFRRDLGRYAGDTDHADVVLDGGRVGRLRGRLRHYTFWTYESYLRKLDRYTRVQAELWHRQGRRPSLLKLVANGPFRFLHSYLGRLGFLDGLPGLQVCLLTGFYSFLKQARLWELHYARPQPDPESMRDGPASGERVAEAEPSRVVRARAGAEKTGTASATPRG
jgi:glycosyltransferase involved in cell wall biosynthesis